ncbi:hypothetical protein [Lacticaseibacillus rhamnosus]|uniref:hypothetical protein n=1 Tax=Lacticaseibacillus rhamnosus TaxID=47715 RepID=UPI001EF1E07F|nr:hypothetical protein [Lacticaseibacillus rhamnosus]MDE3302013.1 hypothetical protein [Lacticaseibacillus rhamnosus]
MLKKMVIWGLLVFTMAGCGSPSANDKPKSTSSAEITSKYYHQLDKKEQSKVFFTFKAVADDSQDGGKYIVDMKVRNSTKSRLKFDLSKFILSTSNTGKPIKSVKHGDLTIAPMQTKTVAGLFDSATAANFNGVGEFCYLSRDFLLAYSYEADKVAGATTDNLKVASLINRNKAATQKSSDSDVSIPSQATTSAPASEASQQATKASTQPTQQSQGSVATEAQAETILRNWFASNGGVSFDDTFKDGLHIFEGASGWSFVDSNGLSWSVFKDGRIKGPGDPQE